jgi:hypothetical protein
MTATQPYPPGPYMATPPPMRPKTNTKIKVLVMVVVLVIVLGCVGCALVLYISPSIYSEEYFGKGHQSYQGIPNGTLLMYKLNVNGFKPQIETGYSEVRVYFYPYCGAQNSSEANKSQALMGRSFISFDHGNNTTNILFVTQRYTDTSYRSHNITENLKCVMAKTKAIFTTEMSLKLVSEDTGKEKYFLPGFDALLVVPAMVVISLIWRRKMERQKK